MSYPFKTKTIENQKVSDSIPPKKFVHTAYEAKLKQDVHHRLKSSEANRLKSIQDELLEFSGGTLLQVDQYIQMINEKYENRFDELERNWIVLERQLARLNEHTKRPEFLKHENRKLPPLNSYNKVRG
ncbi:hypothetical protein NB585_20725 [Vibrio parahaemolyticus]|uniref:hypothetical protein n=1 Tax=Vibrio parahaemolyticus TaxID=670 RepID=UPI00215CC8AD|nr:hypothetical protein [Vibrio parahaemolyticus]MCR9810890.1 hypothetical protein [Vibrio parahaemolyticus]